jgi:hypothetical protein
MHTPSRPPRPLQEWRKEVAESDPVDGQYPGGRGNADRTTLPAGSEEAIEKVRAEIRTLVARSLTVPAEEATLPLRLQVAASAPLMLLPRTDFEVAHAIASLGAGRLLRIRILRFQDPPAESVTFSKRTYGALELEGGDIHGWVGSRYDEELEGVTLPGRRRRRTAAAD